MIAREFTAPSMPSLANTVSLNSLLDGFKGDKVLDAAMAKARKRLASAWYSGAPGSLTALRLKAGLSQAQVADKVGTSQSHIARIESGSNDPTTDVIVRIATALSVAPEEALKAILAQRDERLKAR